MKDPYQVLNIPRGSSRDDIRAAYRALAKRWHPDRFTEGPERDWAGEKMAEINNAYRQCLDGSTMRAARPEDDPEILRQAQHLLDCGAYSDARRMLLQMNTRSAEWNYLFGLILIAQKQREKAVTYLSIACHQKPEVTRYSAALKRAQQEAASGGLLARLQLLVK